MTVQKTAWTRINDKVCCTCEYWNGERELQFLPGVRLNAILAQFNPQGRCQAKMNCLMALSGKDELSDVLRQPRSGILRDLQTVAQVAMKEV